MHKKIGAFNPAICAFLCLFDVQLQTLRTFEEINIL